MNKHAPSTGQLGRLFEYLSEARHFPDYQMERRVDVFFALHLEKILSTCLPDNRQVALIAPEFPLHKENGQPPFRIDYLCYCRQSKKLILVELKTDNDSWRKAQCDYLEKAKALPCKEIAEYVRKLCAKKTRLKSRSKYLCLLQKLYDKELFCCKPIQIALTQDNYRKDIKPLMNIIRDETKFKISENISNEVPYVVFITPTKIKNPGFIDFQIDFQTIIEALALESPHDYLTKLFVDSLKVWLRDKAGYLSRDRE